MNKEQLFKRLEKSWEELAASYTGLTEAQLVAPGVTGDWSVKDLVAHVTWWEEEALKYLPLIQANGRPPRYSVTYGGIDAFNAQMRESRRSLPFQEVMRQRDEIHRRLLDYLQDISDDQIKSETRFRRRLRLDTYHHYNEHTHMIWHWRRQVLGA